MSGQGTIWQAAVSSVPCQRAERRCASSGTAPQAPRLTCTSQQSGTAAPGVYSSRRKEASTAVALSASALLPGVEGWVYGS